MAGCSLTDTLIGNTYCSLLKTSNNNSIGPLGYVTDGDGNESSIQIGSNSSTAGLVVTGPVSNSGGDISTGGDLIATGAVTAGTCITTTGDLHAATTAGNKVGIGTSTPGTKLTVNGSLSANSDVYIDGGKLFTSNGCGTANQQLAVNATATKIEWITPAAGGDFCGDVCGTGTQNFITKFTDPTTIGNSLIQDNGSRLGIDTTPDGTHKLKVNGSVCASSVIAGCFCGNLIGNICDSTCVEENLQVCGTTCLVGDATVGNITSNTGQANLNNVQVAGAFCDCTGGQGSSCQYLKSTGSKVVWAALPAAGAGADATGTVCGTGSGTRIAKFSSTANTIENSAIYQSSNKIGIAGAADTGSCAFKVNGGAKITCGICTTNVTANGALDVCGIAIFGNDAANDSVTSCGNFFVGSDSSPNCRQFSICSSNGNIFTKGILDAGGSIYSDGDIVAFNSSDRRLKDNLTCITDSNNIINGLNNYCFDWNDKSEREGPGIGVIAQDVQKVLPNAVCERDNGDLAVDYNQFIPVLLQRVKELSAEVEDLKAKIS